MYTVMYTVRITLVPLNNYQSILNTDGEKKFFTDLLLTTLQVYGHSLYNIEHLTGRRQSWLFPIDFGPLLDCFGLFKTKSWLSPADASSHCH